MSLVVNNTLTVFLICLALFLIFCLIKAIIGPRLADRMVFVNMMGTIIMIIICILAVKMKEGYLADITILYAMISFLAVVIFCRVYMGVYLERREALEKKEKEEKTNANL